jgi:DNA-directed RNA polymerase alpha subunit
MNSAVRNKVLSADAFKCQFTQTNVSIVNALRRTILADIPTLIIDSNQCTVHKNTTRLNSELLKQRLGQIPVFISDPENQKMAVEEYELIIQTANETPDTVMITTDDFQIRNKTTSAMLTKQQLAAIFPINPITHMPIDFGRMRGKIAGFIPAEELHLTCPFGISTASVDGGYTVVSKATYQCTVDENAAEEAERQYVAKEKEENRESMSEKELEEYITYKTADFRLLDKKRAIKKDSFEFHVVSIGVYTPDGIVIQACNILMKKLSDFMDAVETNQIFIEVLPEHFYEVTIPNDTFTLSKLLEYGLLATYFDRSSSKGPAILSFCTVKRSHPHSTSSVLRLATQLDSTVNDVKDMLKEVSLLLIRNYKRIASGVNK